MDRIFTQQCLVYGGFLAFPFVARLWRIRKPGKPRSAMRLAPADTTLALAGHTHVGQIRIPWLYRKAIPTAGGFDRSEQFAHTPDGKVGVFTMTGVGEIGLSMRLFKLPTIDLLHPGP